MSGEGARGGREVIPRPAGAGGVASGAGDAATRRRTLEERARAAAMVREQTTSDGERVLVFRVGGERYAVEGAAATLVLDVATLKSLLGAPPWLLGAVVARARIVPVLDLRRMLGRRESGMSDLTRIVVVEHRGEEYGIAVEALEGERVVPRGDVAPPSSGPFRWIAADRTALLDLDRLSSPEG